MRVLTVPLLFALFAALACNDSGDSDSGDSDSGDSDSGDSDSGDSDTGEPGADRRDTSGSCAEPVSTCEDATYRELLRVDENFLTETVPSGPFDAVIVTSAAWTAWWQDSGQQDEAPAVDFDTETVLISGYRINASCEVTLDAVSVRRCGETVRLTTTSTDISGTCTVTCDAEAGTVVAVAVPSGSTEACGQVDLTCGS